MEIIKLPDLKLVGGRDLIFALALQQLKLGRWQMHLMWWHGITQIPHLLLESSTSWSW